VLDCPWCIVKGEGGTNTDLGKGLACLELRRSLAGAKAGDAFGREGVGETIGKRLLGPNNHEVKLGKCAAETLKVERGEDCVSRTEMWPPVPHLVGLAEGNNGWNVRLGRQRGDLLDLC